MTAKLEVETPSKSKYNIVGTGFDPGSVVVVETYHNGTLSSSVPESGEIRFDGLRTPPEGSHDLIASVDGDTVAKTTLKV